MEPSRYSKISYPLLKIVTQFSKLPAFYFISTNSGLLEINFDLRLQAASASLVY